MPSIYTSNVPQATQTIAASQPIIQANFGYLSDFGNKDHNFSADSSNATDGYHKDIHIIPQATPAAIVGIMQLYSKTVAGDTQLFARTGGGGQSQLTGYSSAINGFQYLGGVAIQWGMVNPIASGSATISFPSSTVFTAAAYVVLPTLICNSIPTSSTNSTVSIVDGSITATQFTYNFRTSGTNNVGFCWIAIGPAI